MAKKKQPPKYFNLDEAASSLSMSISEIIDYGVRCLLTIQTLTAEGNFIVVPSEDLHRFLTNPEKIIDISELRKPFDYYDEYSYPYADINYPIIKTFVSIKTLLIHEKEFTRFKKQLKSENIKGKVKKPKSIETTLSYDKTTGKFRFGNKESIAVSKASRHKVRKMAEKLMKWWKKGKPCPQSEIVQNPDKKTLQSVYDNRTTISSALKDLKVNMPQCANDEYPPPNEPKHFNIVS